MQLKMFIAGCFGIVGFVASLLAGLYVNNSLESILWRALVALLACYAMGYMIGVVAQFVAREHAQRIAAKVAELDAQAAEALKARNQQADPSLPLTNNVVQPSP